jgi:ligand-binding sensor domain-containing protein
MGVFPKPVCMGRRLFFLMLLLQTVVYHGFSQTKNTQFTNYYTQSNTLSVGGDENVIWIGTTGGISVLNINGTQLGTYTRDNTEGGIAFNAINDVATDKNSVKWFATYGGLSKFDGAKFTRFSGLNSGLKSEFVHTVAVDTLNNKWVGTAAGVYKFDEKVWTNYKKTDGLVSDTITEIAIDKQKNHIWAGTERGLSRFDGTKWTTITKAANALPSNKITALFVDKKSTLWVGTLDAGLASFDGTTWKIYTTNDLGGNSIADITADAAGVLWLATLEGGATSYDGKTFKNYRPNTSGLASTTVRAIFVDVLNNKWFGTDKGVSKFNEQGWVNFNLPALSLASNDIRALAADIAGNIWAGTFNYGISRFDGANWVTYNNTNSGMATNNVNYIAVDKYNVKWICTDKGVYTFDGANWRGNDPSNSGIASYFVRQMAFDSKGNPWFATDGGVARYDGNNIWKIWQVSDTTFADNVITSISIDSKDKVYVGVNKKGLAVYDGKKWSRMNTTAGIISDNITAISIDNKDEVWIGTEKGISVISPTAPIRSYTTTNSTLPDNNITALATTQGGNTWIGTKAGVAKAFNGKFTVFNTLNSNITDNTITAINPYVLGGVWIGTLNGLSKWTPTLEGKITATATKCNGENSGTATVTTVGEAAPFAYKWSSGATEVTAKNLKAGFYTVTIGDNNGDFIATSVEVKEPSLITSKATIKFETIANAKNGSIDVTASGGAGAYNYKWSNGSIGAKNDKVGAGVHTLTITDANGCTKIDTVTVKLCAPLNIAFGSAAAMCFGSKNGKASATITGGTAPYSYKWSNGATAEVVKDLSRGMYKLTVTDNFGCPATDSVSITEPTLMKGTVKTTDVASAAATNGSATLEITGGVAPYMYQWQDTKITGNSATALKAGDYTVNVSDKNACGIPVTFSIKIISAINEPELLRQVQIAPNPTKENVYITLNLEKTAEVHLALYDVLGKIVLQQAIGNTNTATQTLNLSALPQGIYTLKMLIGEDAVVKRIEVVR